MPGSVNKASGGRWNAAAACFLPAQPLASCRREAPFLPGGSQVGHAWGLDVDTAAALRPASVGGRDADLYALPGGENSLVWENEDGVLFWLSAPLSQTEMEQLNAGAETGVTFRLQGTLDRETMIRIAQSVE